MVQGYWCVIIMAYLLFIVGVVYFIGQVKIGDDYLKFFFKFYQGCIVVEIFNDKFSGVCIMDIVVDVMAYGGIKDEVFFCNLNGFQDYFMDYEEVGYIYFYWDVVYYLSINLNGEIDVLFGSFEIVQYLMFYEMLVILGEVFVFCFEDDNQAWIQVFLKFLDFEVYQVFYEDIQCDVACFFLVGNIFLIFGGDVMYCIVFGIYIVEGKVQNIILALLIVFFSCFIIFWFLFKSLMVLLFIIVFLLMVFGLMGVIGIWLGISIVLFMAMIVGIGVDFVVYYLVGYFCDWEEMLVDEVIIYNSFYIGQAIVYDVVFNIVGFSVLLFLGFLLVQYFGWLLALFMLFIFLNIMVLYLVLFM